MNVVRVGGTHVSSLSSEMVKTSWSEPLDSPETGDGSVIYTTIRYEHMYDTAQ